MEHLTLHYQVRSPPWCDTRAGPHDWPLRCLPACLSVPPSFTPTLPPHPPPLQVEHLDIPEALELRKLRLLKEELGELAAHGGPRACTCWLCCCGLTIQTGSCVGVLKLRCGARAGAA